MISLGIVVSTLQFLGVIEHAVTACCLRTAAAVAQSLLVVAGAH